MKSSSSTLKTKRAYKTLKPSESFICELPLKETLEGDQVFHTALEAGRQLYNACLGEAKRRLKLVRQSEEYQQAQRMKKGDLHRTRRFREACQKYGFREYDLHTYVKGIHGSWIGEHIGSHMAQKLASRAFAAVEKLLYRKAKQVRFKGPNQLDSIEEKTNKTGLMWKGDGVQLQGKWIPALINSSDPVVAYGLSKKIKYCRLVRRRIKGRERFFVQLVCEGRPLTLRERRQLQAPNGVARIPVSKGSMGLDIGPSSIACVSKEKAGLYQFCEELQDKAKQIKILQKKQDRQRRANNPDHYQSDGRVKAGPKKWRTSKRQEEVRKDLAEIQRKAAAHRKTLHGRFINEEIPLESEIYLEKLSYRSFQKGFGKSVGIRAPGMFVEKLKRKAENAGGSVVEFSPYSTRLSQTCICGRAEKKPLSQRMHRCICGVTAQRDLFSAYLARFVEGGLLNASAARKSWKGAEALLRSAFEHSIQTASQRPVPESFGVSKRTLEKSGSTEQERATCKR